MNLWNKEIHNSYAASIFIIIIISSSSSSINNLYADYLQLYTKTYHVSSVYTIAARL